MIVRLGYVAISNTINITSSKSVTYTRFTKSNNDFGIIDMAIKSNLHNLIEILKYNDKNGIHFYRLSSNIIPLATHKSVIFDYYDKYRDYYEKIGRIINNGGMRVDMHASSYVVLNSTRKDVVDMAIDSLEYYYNLQKYMGIDMPMVILHVGSSEGGKDKAISRFVSNFNKLPDYLKKMILLENDDKIFDIEDVIHLSNKLNIPIVLDYHHHLCNHKNKDITMYMDSIIDSWKNVGLRPKMHFSTSLSKRQFRAHNDYIMVDDFVSFLAIIRDYNKDVDIMLEAKEKDVALFKLIRELRYRTNYKFIDETTFML